MFTRKQFIDKECTFTEYYDQLISPRSKSIVTARFKKNFTLADVKSMPLESWDAISNFYGSEFAQRFIDLGDVCTQSGMVCLFKHTATKMAVEAT